jgi:hypothetical protein
MLSIKRVCPCRSLICNEEKVIELGHASIDLIRGKGNTERYELEEEAVRAQTAKKKVGSQKSRRYSLSVLHRRLTRHLWKLFKILGTSAMGLRFAHSQ